MTLIKKTLIFFLGVTLLTSCSTNEDYSTNKSPIVTYTINEIEAVCFTPGNSEEPNVNWAGNQGEFSLSSAISGLYIDTTTGVLNWDHNLSLGSHAVKIRASNSAGHVIVDLTINNPLQGVFTGTYTYNENNTLFFYEIEFNSDNTVIVTEKNGDSLYSSNGTWKKNGTTISIDYTSSYTDNDYSISGTLSNGTDFIYSGNWYFNHGSVSGNEGGAFEVILE